MRLHPVTTAEAERLCESPIEVMFLAAFSHVCCDHAFRRTKAWSDLGDDDPICIRPQAPIGRYRVDFLIQQAGTSVVVECDGHNFHERTPEQAIRDRARDRLMQEQGFVVLRFTGRELNDDAYSCAEQVFRFIDDRAPKPTGEIVRPFERGVR